MTRSADDRTPVLVGAGTATQRCSDPAQAAEPLELMHRALAAAGRDAGSTEALTRLGDIAVPHGRWEYDDPGRALAERVGATSAHTLRAEVGVLQQTLIGRACELVAAGAVEVAAVVGGEAGDRLRQAARAGTTVTDSPAPGRPDVVLVPDAEMRLPVETSAGLFRAVGYYAIIESAYRHRQGWTVGEGQERVAELYSRLAEQSVDNPDAWRPERVDADTIRRSGDGNPMMAFPYARRHVSSWSVDQAGALVVCSVATARRLGIAEDRWLYPLVSAESNHMLNVCRRRDLGRSVGAAEVARAVLEHGELSAHDIDLAELYSCFPVAVELFAEAFGLGTDRPLSVTGGMPWAGGPYNNYVIQATCRMADLLRGGAGSIGVLSCVSGLMTKQAAAGWSTRPPARAFANVDVTPSVAAASTALEVVDDYTGPAVVAGYTVLHDRDSPPRGVAVLDLPDGRRTVAHTEDRRRTADMERTEWCGRQVHVVNGVLR